MVTYRDAVLADNPHAFFEFNEEAGGTVASTVNGYTATVNGGVVLGENGPKGGKSVYFDGATGHLAIQNLTDFQAGNNTTGFTLEMWVKFDSQTMDYPTFIRRDGNGKAVLVRTRGPGSGGRVHDIETYNSGRSAYTNDAFADNQWHHVCVTSFQNTLRQWIDGTERGVGLANGTVNAGGTGTTPPTFIGKGDGATEYFKGWIAQVAVYRTNLSPTRVLAHYNASAAPVEILTGKAGNLGLDALPSTIELQDPPLRIDAGAMGTLSLHSLDGPVAEFGPMPPKELSVSLGREMTFNGTGTPTLSKASIAGRAKSITFTGLAINKPHISSISTKVVESGKIGKALVLQGVGAPTVVTSTAQILGVWYLQTIMPDSKFKIRHWSPTAEAVMPQKTLKTHLANLVRN